MDWYIKQQQQQHEQLRQRQLELQMQQHETKQRLKQKHSNESDHYLVEDRRMTVEKARSEIDDENDDLAPDDSISNHAGENDKVETDDDKLRRLSTAEKQAWMNIS